MSLMNIKFKTLDGDHYSVSFDSSLPISKLRYKISWKLKVSEKNLILIFRGKKLQDQNYLSDYDFEEGKTLNVIAKKEKKNPLKIKDGKI